MVNMEQIRRGAMKYLSRELVPMMDKGKGILVEVFAPAVIDANLKKYMEADWLKGTGLVDGLSANVEEIYKLIKQGASGKWPVELMGFRFSESDLDKLYQCIKEG